MGEFEHKGVKITLESDGNFRAHVNGKYQRAPSLAAMKSRIDKANAFEPFDALVKVWGETKRVRIVGVQKAKGAKSYRNSDEWIAEGLSKGFRAMIRYTPEQEVALKAYDDAQKETRRLVEEFKEQRNAVERELRDKVLWETIE